MLATKKQSGAVSRRHFLKRSGLASLGFFTVPALLEPWSLFKGPDSKILGVQIGVITYSYRSLPGSLQEILQYTVNSGISAVELMGDAVEQYAGCPSGKKAV
ncbi:hypothetical protein [Niabella sp.]|uniref:hypothetical protein n=1 Tax=Niabella sp. TaxID=1962976 RepID=UPI0026285630|nr:hypothetical protein [Niabella sp.]